MPIIAAQIAPQRSTQYTEMVTELAPYEIKLSQIGEKIIHDVTVTKLGTQDYLKFEVKDLSDLDVPDGLGNLVMTDAYFVYYDRIESVEGPLLKPIEVSTQTILPDSLITTRRYRGKTNEMLTQLMCNLARYSSDYRSTPWNKLTLLDPLAGGGTTLFAGLMLGADVVGVEKDKKVVEGTVAFLKQYASEEKLPVDFRVDRLKKIGKRWFVTVNQSMRCVIGHGDTADVKSFVHGLKQPQLIVTDLPYGIQHYAEWQSMLATSLPEWAKVLAEGGALVFSWNATRFSRHDMIELVESVSDFKVLNQSPYDQLAHRVDRVIKQRDILVARIP